MSSMRETSRRNWASANTVEHINADSLQRIADATEAMAVSHVQLQKDRDLYHSMFKDELERRQRLERSNANLRGVITKLKNAALNP